MAAALLTACGSSGSGDAHVSWSSPASGASTPTSQPTGVGQPSTAPTIVPPVHAGPTFEEIAANRRGTMVFPDNVGGALRTTIPYETTVQVECWVTNRSDMTSINAFYRVVAPQEFRGYAPANTFANGDQLGTNGPTQLDPKVPRCAGN